MQTIEQAIKDGICVFFTGLSGAGKSTLAMKLKGEFSKYKYVTLLDGDFVRIALSAKLGFSKEDRDLNIIRIGYVASEIVKHGGVVICAAIAPYEQARVQVRDMFPPGKFILIHVHTPLIVCELRDVKGLYKKARSGKIKNFTGISDPYELPLSVNTELTVTTENREVYEVIDEILTYIKTGES